MRQAQAVCKTLEEIGAAGIPVVDVLNKIDRFPAPDAVLGLMTGFPGSVAISARTGEGVESLLSRVEQVLEQQMVSLDVLIPYELGELVDLFHRRGLIEEEEHTETGTRITGRLSTRLAGRFRGLEAAARLR
jgi:GTP-binding protein HflX